MVAATLVVLGSGGRGTAGGGRGVYEELGRGGGVEVDATSGEAAAVLDRFRVESERLTTIGIEVSTCCCCCCC